jgi:hypothetical protein
MTDFERWCDLMGLDPQSLHVGDEGGPSATARPDLDVA